MENKIQTGQVTVMVHMNAEPEHLEELVRHSQNCRPIFAKQPGFISDVLYKDTEGRGLIQYLEWQDLQSHENCMQSADWNTPESKAFVDFCQANNVSIDPRVYETLP